MQLPGFANKKIWQLAWPMILANITVPLLGFVDTAVIGHLNSSDFLAGTALGSLVITITFWLLGFLRMSTTALASQAHGRKDHQALSLVLTQASLLALLLAILVLIFQQGLFQFMLAVVHSDQDMMTSLAFAKQYFDIRIWVAPVSLLNLVMTGYLIGIGQTKAVLKAVIICNLVNLFADILFVPVLGFDVAGVAYATMLAESVQFVILLVANIAVIQKISLFNGKVFQGLGALIAMNRILFVRSALLQFCISFMTIYASRFGPNAVAVNAIIMQFFLFLSFALDGVAFALESLIGQRYGQKQWQKVKLLITKGVRMGLAFALFYTVIYFLFASTIFALLTDIDALRNILDSYYGLVVLLPLGSFLCFIFDGIFVGLGWAKAMRNSMFIATLSFMLAVTMNHFLGGQNWGLWVAFWLFLLMRGVSQWWLLKYKLKGTLAR